MYLCGASGGCLEGHLQHLALSSWGLCGALLPGVPHLLQQKWPAVSAELQAAVQLAPFSNRVVRLLSEDEAAVAPLLDTLAAEWGSEISLGSYPVRMRRLNRIGTASRYGWEVVWQWEPCACVATSGMLWCSLSSECLWVVYAIQSKLYTSN